MGLTAKQREMKAAKAAARAAAEAQAEAERIASQAEAEAERAHLASDPAQQSIIRMAADLCRWLGESEPRPRRQILRCVQAVGPDLARDVLDEVMRIEKAGGEYIESGMRLRTSGGIFFRIVRELLPPEEALRTFGPPPTHPHEAPSGPPLRWADRLAIVQQLGRNSSPAGKVKMRVAITGRPSKVLTGDSCVAFQLHDTKVPTLPKGLPVPEPGTLPATTYTCYVSSKQWRRVADALTADPADLVILEGWPHLDEATHSIALFATSATTRNIEAVRKDVRTAAAG